MRWRILELLGSGERAAGDVASAIHAEFGLTSQPYSRHLRVLRESGSASVRSAGTRRLYALDAAGSRTPSPGCPTYAASEPAASTRLPPNSPVAAAATRPL